MEISVDKVPFGRMRSNPGLDSEFGMACSYDMEEDRHMGEGEARITAARSAAFHRQSVRKVARMQKERTGEKNSW